MAHDCSITETTLAVYDLPVTFNLDAAMAGNRFPYLWDADYGARVGLMPLSGDPADVQWFEVEPCYVYHPVNAWDVDGGVVVDVVRYPTMFVDDPHGPNDGTPVLWRWTFDRASGKATEEQLDDVGIELPRVDERLVGREHRWSWATSLPDAIRGDVRAGVDADAPLIRYDRTTGTSEAIHFGPGKVPGEAVFVPRTPDAAEDDGWYLTLVVDASGGPTDLAVLDASAPTEGPVATVHLPARVPVGFHGNWVPTGS
jgi:carotenoid cleavage dioxygenase